VTPIVIQGKNATEIIDIVQELKRLGLVQGENFEFIYHKGEWDAFTYDSPKSYTVFEFTDPTTATWFSLKYK
jgi:hypothetical protein